MLFIILGEQGIDSLNAGEQHPVESLVFFAVTGADLSTTLIPFLIPVALLDKDVR